MVFFASLVAYVVSVVGILLAFAMSYSAVLAPPPDQPPAVHHVVVATTPASTPAPSIKMAVKATHVRVARSEHHKALAANDLPRPQRSGPLDLRAHAGLWANLREPGVVYGHLGYAEEPDDSNQVR
jgi:hypothetical protein